MAKVANIKKGEKYDIYIGRPSKYGNIFSHLPHSRNTIYVPTREAAVQAYEDWLLGREYTDIKQDRRYWILEHLRQLKGKTLGCYCSPLPCHGDVLVKLVKKIEEQDETQEYHN